MSYLRRLLVECEHRGEGVSWGQMWRREVFPTDISELIKRESVWVQRHIHQVGPDVDSSRSNVHPVMFELTF